MDALVIAFLIELLGHPSFRCREQAHAALAARGAEALPALALATGHSDPEVRHRARLLTADWVGAILPTAGGPLPWIDMKGEDFDQATQDEYLRRARGDEYNGWSGDDWPDYRYATSLLIRDLVAQGWERGRIVALLDRMAAREVVYKEKRRP